MRCSIALPAGLLVALAVGACADSSDRSPTAPDLKPAPTNACSFRTARQLAGDVFATPTRQQVGTQIDAMEAATGPARDNIGFDILRTLAAVVNLGTQIGDPNESAAFANGIVSCQSFAASLTLPLALASSLDPDVDGRVRGAGRKRRPRICRWSPGLLPHYSALGPYRAALRGWERLGNAFCSTARRTPAPQARPVARLAGVRLEQRAGQSRDLAARHLIIGLCAFSSRSLIQEKGDDLDGIVFYQDVGDLEATADAHGRLFCDRITAPPTPRAGGCLAGSGRRLLPRRSRQRCCQPAGHWRTRRAGSARHTWWMPASSY